MRFPIAVLQRAGLVETGSALAVCHGKGSHRKVAVANEAARKLGVAKGMHPNHATMRCPALQLVEWDDDAFERETSDLIAVLATVSPRVSAAGLGRFWLEPYPSDDEPGFVVRCEEVLVAAGFLPERIVVGIADGAVAAAAAAHQLIDGDVCGTPRRGSVPAGQDAAWLSGLPITGLPIGLELAGVFKALGITRVAQLQEMPIAALQARFGLPGVRAWQLAWGIDPLAGPRRVRPSIGVAAVSIPLLEPTSSLSNILFVLRGALASLCQTASQRGRVLRGVALRLVLELGEDLVAELPLSRPSVEQRLLFELLRLQLERWREHAAVDGVTGIELWPTGLDEAQVTQNGLFERSHHQVAALEALYARLMGRWGRRGAVVDRSEAATPTQAVLRQGHLRRLEVPHPVRVSQNRLQWGPSTLEITQWFGPERLVGRWWSAEAFDVSMWWVVTADGDALRLSKETSTAIWRVHGWLD